MKAEDFSTWLFTIEVMGESLYPVSEPFPPSCLYVIGCNSPQGEVYTLQFRFDTSYPISSPAVQFVVTDGKEAPVHPVRSAHSILARCVLKPKTPQHVYSNGHVRVPANLSDHFWVLTTNEP